jgi:SPP1 gp7 family putative phage head morphogenesis protein
MISLRANARTIAMIRVLKAIGPIRKTPGRVPRQQQPDAIRLEYFKAIHGVVIDPLLSAFKDAKSDILRILIDERRARGKMDVARSAEAAELIDRAAAFTMRQIGPRAIYETAEKFGKRTSQFNRQQLDRQLRSAVGVSLGSIERPTQELIPLFASQNVELIKTVPERYHDRIKRDVLEAFEAGMHPETLADRFVELDDMAESDARRIARDQIGKLNAQFNEQRQTAIGVTHYVWRTARDNRVRDEHAELEGKTIAWSDPPPDGHPGEPIQCRCFADPVLDDIVNDL